MTTTYSVDYRCDDGRAPGCAIRVRYAYDALRHLDRARGGAEAAGWRLGFRPDAGGVVRSYDLCPACAALPGQEPAASGSQ